MSIETIYPASQIRQEIRWIEKKIESLQPKLQRRPSTMREINDLRRQIVDREKLLAERGVTP